MEERLRYTVKMVVFVFAGRFFHQCCLTSTSSGAAVLQVSNREQVRVAHRLAVLTQFLLGHPAPLGGLPQWFWVSHLDCVGAGQLIHT